MARRGAWLSDVVWRGKARHGMARRTGNTSRGVDKAWRKHCIRNSVRVRASVGIIMRESVNRANDECACEFVYAFV